MKFSSALKKVRTKLRSKTKASKDETGEQSGVEPSTGAKSDINAAPYGSRQAPGTSGSETYDEGPAWLRDGDHQGQSVPVAVKSTVSPPKPSPPIDSPKPVERRPASVTMQERIRYQKMVLGMTDEQIRKALPPGIYSVESSGSAGRPLVGNGDLAYAYYSS